MSNTTPRIDPWHALCARLGIAPSTSSAPAATPASHATRTQNAVDMLRGRPDGERTDHLTRLAGMLFAAGAQLVDVEEVCLIWNSRNPEPLDEAKVLDTCRSIELTDRRQHPERAALRDAHADPALLPPLFDLADAAAGRFVGCTPPPRRWVLKDFLPLGIAGGLVSPGGVGKSQFLMQMAYAVATGMPLAGHWNVGEPGAVLMLCAEDDEAELHRRFGRIHRQLGQAGSSDVDAAWRSRLFIRSTVGTDTLMTVKGQNREVIRTAWPERLLRVLKSRTDFKLIILDPASRFRGGEENSNEDGTRFVEALEYLSLATGATVLVAHHSNKASMNNAEAASQAHARGASSLTDGLRWQLSLTTVGEKHRQRERLQARAAGHYVEVSLVKSNYTAPQEPVYLRREDDGYLDYAGPGSASAAGNPQLVQLLQLIGAPGASLTAKRIEVDHCGPGKAIAMPEKAVRALIARARQDGLIDGRPRQALFLTAKGQQTLSGTRQAAGGQNAAKPRAAKKSR